jgi:hypothetical protein
MLRRPVAFALAAAVAGLMTAVPAAAQTSNGNSRHLPAPCRVSIDVERISCNAPMGRSRYPVPPVSHAILFGPAWEMPTFSEAGGPAAISPRDATARRQPVFIRPVTLN